MQRHNGERAFHANAGFLQVRVPCASEEEHRERGADGWFSQLSNFARSLNGVTVSDSLVLDKSKFPVFSIIPV